MSKQEKYIVVGLGQTGLSSVAYLHQQGFLVSVMDTRNNPPLLNAMKEAFPQIPVHLGPLDESILCSATHLVVSPGLSLQEPAIQSAIDKGIKPMGDVELFARAVQAKVVGITGTNGKSTVTSLVGDMAQAAGVNASVAGNIGIPVLDVLQEGPKELYVLELSSWQLESTYSLKLQAATVLNVSDNHLDRHKTLDNYLQAKLRIFDHCEVAIVNDDVDIPIPDGIKHSCHFSLNTPKEDTFGIIEEEEHCYLAYGSKKLLDTQALPIKGRHNWSNALAALAFGKILQFPMEDCIHALKNFKGLSHRCQFIGKYQDVAWYNDSKSTNVGAAQWALKGIGNDLIGKVIWIAGGQGKQADFSPLQAPAKRFAKQVILFGEDAPAMAQALDGACPTQTVTDLSQAVALAKQLSEAGDAVLFSPACASFDMFKNFEHRGDVFCQLVKEIN